MIEPEPFRIYLMRHAQAASAAQGGRDFDRELDGTGYAQAEIVADKAADLRYVPDCIISSTAMRCRQTAEIVRRRLGETLEVQFIDELYNGTPEIYATVISGQRPARSVLLIGHNPSIDQLLEGLIGGGARRSAMPGGYPTAAMTILDYVQTPTSENNWALIDLLKS
ncbi:histidine phosphatase family protein [Neorhizobium sp. NCHU2750]|uniref:SixA phosphatase family protein n=1 Tax=Neorhizobium sp. NCHU2750 TaxID=1825976 RepID=UPI000E70EE20|nr:phosphohistidine phosphatase [Neorhizobium sp. NCHU2750]